MVESQHIEAREYLLLEFLAQTIDMTKSRAQSKGSQSKQAGEENTYHLIVRFVVTSEESARRAWHSAFPTKVDVT